MERQGPVDVESLERVGGLLRVHGAGVLIGLCGRRGAGGGMGPTETRKIGEKLGGEVVD